MTHLSALQHRLSNEQGYLATAKSDGERRLHSVWIAQIQREIAREKVFVGADLPEMSDDELLAELGFEAEAV